MPVDAKKIPNDWTAIGLALHFCAKHEPFRRYTADALVRTITGEVQRGHYLFALDSSAGRTNVVGYLGWALYDHGDADRFAATGIPPGEGRSQGGDVVWVLTAAASQTGALYHLGKSMRALYPGYRVMAIRHKDGGRRILFDQWRARLPGNSKPTVESA